MADVPTQHRALIDSALSEAAELLDQLRRDSVALSSIALAADLLVEAFRRGNKAIACGNGGSMSDAMHFAEELSGRFREDRAALPALAVSDPGHLSCVANDYGYQKVFARFVEAHGVAGDVLLAISTSGGSENVFLAAQEAQRKGMKVIALTGRRGSALEESSDVAIITEGRRYADRVQELHIKVIHSLIECVEQALFGTVGASEKT